MIGTRFENHLPTLCRAFGAAFLSTFLIFGAATSDSARAGTPAPTFTMVFDPGTVGPGSAAVLRYEISEGSGSPVDDLAFTNTLPAGLTLATPVGAVSTCGFGSFDVLSGATISFSGGSVFPLASCEIEVLVTGTAIGTYMNTTGDLTSSAGNSGPASADLVIAADRPGFSKRFSSPTTVIGQRERLTFRFDNSLNANVAANIVFSDPLPTGLVIADPANLSNTCDPSITSPFPLDYTGGNVIAEPGSGVIALGFGNVPDQAAVDAGGTCEIGVDVVSASIGPLDNISDPMTSAPPPFGQINESGRAAATLDVQGGSIVLIKEFLDDPVPPGETIDLRFTILNRTGGAAAANVNFTDDLDATLSGLVATGLPAGNVCGAGSSLTGTSTLTLIGGQLPARSQCSFEVTLQVPAGAAPGIYPNASSSIEADFGAGPVLGNIAIDDLFVFAAPRLTKTFIENPAPSGGATTIEFTIENTSTDSSATDLAFTDVLSNFLPVPLPVTLPAPGFCGPSSTMIAASLSNTDSGLLVDGGELAPGASCTFEVGIDLPIGLPPSIVVNRTSSISGIVGVDAVTGRPAEAQLQILGAPQLTKTFIDDPVQPGDTVSLEFTLSYSEGATAAATGITFTDDLGATLPGLAATGLPANDICGAGSQLSGTTNLTLTGASLLPGDSCSFQATLQVPAAAAPGPYPNTTSAPEATVLGETVTGLAATDALDIASLSFGKQFTNDPVLPGGTVTLSYTIGNDSATEAASDISFSDNISDALSGLVGTGLPLTDPCGAGSQLIGLSGNGFLLLSGGSLAPGDICTFSVELQVPAGAASNSYNSTTSNLSATVAGDALSLPPANDVLVVDNLRLQLVKEFTDDPAGPGDTVTLEFTLDNLDADSTITGITFTDDLDAALAGLAAVGLPAPDVCGTGSQLSGTSVLTLTGATLPPGGQCVFGITLQLPASLPSAGSVTNVTSEVSGTLGGLPVRGDPAGTELQLQNLQFTKAFSGPSVAGGTVDLEYTITNPDPVNAAGGLAFSDVLGSVIPGLVAVGLPQADVCGAGSALGGTSLITLTGASLAPGASCSFDFVLQVPAGAPPGDFPSISSELTSGGLAVAPPAAATLTIEPPPLFTKAFAASPIPAGAITTLTFSIDNGASILAATDLAFSDPLPAGLVIADPPNPGSTCDGAITAAPGSGTIGFSAGNVGAGATCSVSVDIRALTDGTLTNTTSPLTSSSGESAPATAVITVQPAPVPLFAKVFATNPIPAGGVTTLSFAIDNSASQLATSGLAFSDPLPAGLVIADPAGATSTCGGALVAAPGTGLIDFSGGTVAAGASCSLTVQVLGISEGSFTNTTSALVSSAGTTAPAQADITVDPAPVPLFSKAFAPDDLPLGNVSRLTLTIDNSGALLDATGLAFTDPLPTSMVLADPVSATNDCGGTLTAAPGGASIELSGGAVDASATCRIQVDVVTSAAGALVNTTSALTSSLGTSDPATATLTARRAPGFSKAFSPNPVAIGAISRLTFTIDNSAETVPADGLTFDDPLPAGLVIATPANAVTDCTSGTLAAPDGGSQISFAGGSVAAGSACTVRIDISAQEPGNWLNITSLLDSSLGTGGEATATLVVNEDSDGIPASIEDQAPNGGDGNNDGIRDAIQDDVASLPAFDGSSFITVVAGGSCDTLTEVVTLSPTAQSAQPPADLVFPFGLVGFALPCETALVDIIFHEALTGFSDRYFKFGPTTPGDPATEQWYDFDGATRAGNVWTLSLADNAPGDASGDDGIINDPGGPTLPVLAVPATGLTMLALMALLLLLMARSHLYRPGRSH